MAIRIEDGFTMDAGTQWIIFKIKSCSTMTTNNRIVIFLSGYEFMIFYLIMTFITRKIFLTLWAFKGYNIIILVIMETTSLLINLFPPDFVHLLHSISLLSSNFPNLPTYQLKWSFFFCKRNISYFRRLHFYKQQISLPHISFFFIIKPNDCRKTFIQTAPKSPRYTSIGR